MTWTGGTLDFTNSPYTAGNLTLTSGYGLEVSGRNQTLSVTGTLALAGGQASAYNVVVSGGGNISLTGTGSNLSVTNSCAIGSSSGAATLSVTQGGTASIPILDVGDDSTGNVTITGSGSSVGCLNVMVGSYAGSGTLVLGSPSYTDTGAQLSSFGNIYVGGDSSGQHLGTGIVDVYAGDTLTTARTLIIWPGATVNLAGGTINAAILNTNNGSGLFKWTSGTLATSASLEGVLALNIPSSGKLTFEPNSTGSITLDGQTHINTGGQIDITNNRIYFDYAGESDPISSIAKWIASGYNGGAWNGSGIISSTAQTNSKSYGIGYADYADPGNPADLSSGTVEIMYTLLGDANLDGKVNGADFTLMAANFNHAVTNGWDEGDFNYDGAVNGNDFVLLADNFNQFASQSAVDAADLQALESFAAANGISLTNANVPEPACVGIGMLGILGILRRRARQA
jgi:hypothetical protein